MGGFSVYALLVRERNAHMSSLNPYSHSCTEHPRLLCPACEWAREQLIKNRAKSVSNLAERAWTEVVQNHGPTIPTDDAVKIFLEIAALFLTVFVLLPWACGMLR